MYTIFEVPKYENQPLTWCKSYTGSIDKICKRLLTDKQYHERLTNRGLIKFNIDLDGLGDLTKFKTDLIHYLATKNITVTDTDISYTQNFAKFKDDVLQNSYHLTVPKLYSTPSLLKNIWTEFISIYKYGAELDTRHINSKHTGSWFRLPNQTKAKKQNTQHIIQNGELKDFVLRYIAPNSINLHDYIKFPLTITRSIKHIKNNIKREKANVGASIQYSEDILNCYITPDSEQIVTMIKNLNPTRFDSYDDWFTMGSIIFSLSNIYNFENGFKIFDEFSKKSIKYTPESCVILWNSLTKCGYNIGTLWYLLEKDNPSQYKILKPHYNFRNVFNIKQYDSVIINKQYLVGDGDDAILKMFDDFMLSDCKTFAIRSPYNTRKTGLIKEIQKKYVFDRILIPSYRRSLTFDLYKNYKDMNFCNYLDDDINSDLLIIQLESLLKLHNCHKMHNRNPDEIIIPYYDLVIIDEVESILSHFSSTTFNGESKHVFEFLCDIIKNCDRLIVMDGDFSNRSYEFIKDFGKSMIIENTYNNNNKEFFITPNKQKFYSEITRFLSENKRIVIASMSSGQADFYNSRITYDYPDKTVFLYTGLTDDKVKSRHFKDVDTYFSQADVLIYSPTISAGVSYDIPNHYNKIFGILYAESGPSQRDFTQMLARVRKIDDSVITLLNTSSLPIQESAAYWTYNECLESCKLSRDKLLSYKTVIDDNGNMIKRLYVDTYTKIQIYNRVEQLNKNSIYFMPYFIQLGKSKHFIFNLDNEPYNRREDEQETGNVNKINQILESPDIDENQYNKLVLKQKRAIGLYDEKLQCIKYEYKQLLGLENLDADIMAIFYKKDYLIKNFVSLIDPENLNNYDDYNTEIQHKQLKVVKNVIETLGFSHCYDDNKIDYTTFSKNMENLIKNNVLFTDFQNTRELFGLDKANMFDFSIASSSFKYINSILNQFSIKITRQFLKNKKKITQNNVYYMEQLNNIDNIIYNIKDTLKDKNNIIPK